MAASAWAFSRRQFTPSAQQISPSHSVCNFGGLGLAHEAAELALKSLFTEFDVTCVFATTDRQNLRSAKLLTRLGFTRVQPASYPHGNVLISDDVYQLSRDDVLA
jgi:RimJ/RimL family protein N-acetyltransferase